MCVCVCVSESERERERERGRNGVLYKGKDKLHIACHSKNLSAVKLSKSRPVKCTKDKKAYEQVSVTLREIEN